MNLFIFKLQNFLIFFKSKILKKKIKIKNKIAKNNFIDFIKSKNFSSVWFLNNFDIFHYFLPADLDKDFSYLEIGSFEGLSALNVLFHYKNAKVTTIDLWDQSNVNSEALEVNFNEVEKRFNKNLEDYTYNKIKKDSVIALREILRKKLSFDVIYIDGSHNGEDILSDAIECYKILSLEGIIIFDDIGHHNENVSIQSYVGFQKFCEIYKDKVKILYLGKIAVIKKL